MITNLPAHTRERIDELRTFHVAAPRSWWSRLAGQPIRCVMCGIAIGRCQQRKWAEAVAAGRTPPAGFAVPQQRTRAAAWWEV